ncbi:hypothetical protein C0J52_13642 [Blattella germanica]|nr:hypothetical protein C0J52_13642 [Blattella germanica]
MANLGLNIPKVVPAMWEALNAISLSICKSGYLLAHMYSRVANRLPCSGSLILWMQGTTFEGLIVMSTYLYCVVILLHREGVLPCIHRNKLVYYNISVILIVHTCS